MYVTINLPGSRHFEYYGPATRLECAAWLDRRVEKLLETEQVTSILPRRIVSNKDAQSWKYLDGSRVARRPQPGNFRTRGEGKQMTREITRAERVNQLDTLNHSELRAYRNICKMSAGFMNGADETVLRDLEICEQLLRARGRRIPRGNQLMTDN